MAIMNPIVAGQPWNPYPSGQPARIATMPEPYLSPVQLTSPPTPAIRLPSMNPADVQTAVNSGGYVFTQMLDDAIRSINAVRGGGIATPAPARVPTPPAWTQALTQPNPINVVSVGTARTRPTVPSTPLILGLLALLALA